MNPRITHILKNTGMISGSDWDNGVYAPWHTRSLSSILLRIAGLSFCFLILKIISSGFPENLLQWALLPAAGVIVFFLVELYAWHECKLIAKKASKEPEEPTS